MTLGGSGDVRTLTIADFGANNAVTVRATADGFFDEITVVRVRAGTDVVSGFLTNEAHSVPTDAAGNVISYAGATGTFRVFFGGTEVTATAAFSVIANPQSLTVSGPTAGTGAYSITAGLDAGEANATVTFRATYLGRQIDKVFSLGKAQQGAASWTPILSGVVRDGQTFTKASGTGAWNAAFRSQEGYEGCFVTFRPSQANADVMVGLNTDPAADDNYTSLDYAWLTDGGGNLRIYESGSEQQNLGAYSANEPLTILYDRVRVSYYRDTTLIRSTPRIGVRLFADSSFFTIGAAVNSVAFGPMGPAGYSSGNLLRLDPWTAGALTSSIGNFSLVQSTNGENAIINGVGPHGASQLLWECQCVDPGLGTGGEANGGWGNAGDLKQVIDATKSYRSTVWVRVRAAVGANNFYHGCGTAGDTVNLDGSANSNPYFNSGLMHSTYFAIDKWYLSVGMIHGSGYTGGQSGLSGLWDPATGRRAVAGTDFRMAAGARTQEHRAFMYYGGNTTTRQDLTDPRFEVMDGTEPTLSSLLVPTDADNTGKKRLAPDSEFAFATDQTYWYLVGSPPPVISLTGGNVAGRAIFDLTQSTQTIVSRRNPALQAVTNEAWTIKCRWRRRGTITGFGLFRCLMDRNNQLPTAAAPSFSGIIVCAGGLYLDEVQMNARTVDVWQEEEAICLVVADTGYVGGSLPYLRLWSDVESNLGGTNLEVDLLDAVPGSTGQPFKRTFSAGATLAERDMMTTCIYDSASAGTLTLPTHTPRYENIRIYFEQAGAGLLTIGAPGAGLLLSPPNASGNRALMGRYARAFVEGRGGNWYLAGALA